MHFKDMKVNKYYKVVYHCIGRNIPLIIKVLPNNKSSIIDYNIYTIIIKDFDENGMPLWDGKKINFDYHELDDIKEISKDEALAYAL